MAALFCFVLLSCAGCAYFRTETVSYHELEKRTKRLRNIGSNSCVMEGMTLGRHEGAIATIKPYWLDAAPAWNYPGL